MEALQYDTLLELLSSVFWVHGPDKWKWDLESSGIFSVKSSRKHIDNHTLPMGMLVTR